MKDPKKRFTENISSTLQQQIIQAPENSDKENFTQQKQSFEKEPTLDQSKLMEETIENPQLKSATATQQID